MSRSIEVIVTGAAIFSAAVGYVAVRNQLSPFWQITGLVGLAILAVFWFSVFGMPVVNVVLRVARERFDANPSLIPRIEGLEGRMKELKSESDRHMLMLSLLEFSWGTTTVILLGDRMSADQYLQRLRVALPTARRIAEHMPAVEGGQEFQAMLSSSLDLLIVAGRVKSIPFERVASLLISELTIPTAKRIVTVSSIIDGYGMDNASKWRSMVGET